MIPGEYILSNEDIECNVGRTTIKIAVVNTGDRPCAGGISFSFL
ncbi:MAG: urease subunit beta [Ferruginibacter sp.]